MFILYISAAQSKEKRGFVMVFIMSHGNENRNESDHIYGSNVDDPLLSIESIIRPFKANELGESLKGKPKIFIIQV